jgi:NADPH2:quinone reductase
MRAIRVSQFGEPQVLKIDQVPDPSPAAGQLVVRIHAAGVNPVDTYIRTGTYARKPPLPYTPGSDGAGVVESVGPQLSRFKTGDRVYVIKAADPSGGTYAQRVLCDEAHVLPLPESISFAQGAAVGVPYGTAYRALFDRANAQTGETILVHGATGGVGIAAVQLAAARGISVIGTGGTEAGRKLVREQGACHVLDHRAAGYLDEVMKLTDGKGVDVIIEMLANVNLGKDLTVLAPRGRVVVVGSRGPVEINPRDTMAKETAILGMSLFAAGEEPVLRAHAAIVEGLASGELRPIVGKELPLADAATAHAMMLRDPAFGKIVLLP